MAWLEIRLDTTTEAIDWVKTLLVGAIAPQDLHITQFLGSELDTAEPIELWEFTILLYFPEDGRSRAKVKEVEQILSPLHRTGLTTEMQVAIVEEKLAIAPYLQNQVGEKFLIVSPDSLASEVDLETLELETGRIPLIINPSLAFGSGLHPATMVSLQMLERYVQPEMHTLDLGSGSGVLSVAMAKLGATVLALDNDPIAVLATQEAIDRNRVTSQVLVQAGSLGKGKDLGLWLGGSSTTLTDRGSFADGDSLTDRDSLIDRDSFKDRTVQSLDDPEGKFDLIIANIFARIHATLAKDFYQALRAKGDFENNDPQDEQGGLLVTAGFTTDQEDDVLIACGEVGFEVRDRLCQNDWVALVHHRNN